MCIEYILCQLEVSNLEGKSARILISLAYIGSSLYIPELPEPVPV